jgi:hypothetical protein
MYWDVVDVKVTAPLTLTVKFQDGTLGKVMFKTESLYGVFEPLKDPDFFKQVFIDGDAVAWPGEVDVAPDAMYEEIRQHGEWVI